MLLSLKLLYCGTNGGRPVISKVSIAIVRKRAMSVEKLIVRAESIIVQQRQNNFLIINF